MSIRRAARAAAVVTFAAAAAVAAVPLPSGAQEPDGTGWWSRRAPFTGEVEGASRSDAVRFRPAARAGPQQVGPVTTLPNPVTVPTVPPPPVTLPDDSGPGTPNPAVPDGGLWVANDPTGALAISALRFTGDIGSAELTVVFAPGGTTAGPVVACPVLVPFTPGEAGAWRDRPAHDCNRISIAGRVSPDGSALTFAIPTEFRTPSQDTLDVVLLPDPASGDPFSVFFEAPDASALEVFSGAPTTAPPATFAPPDLGGGSDGFSPGLDGGSGGFDGGTAGGLPTPTDTAGQDTSSPTTNTGGQRIAELLSPFTESRTARIAAIVTLLGMAGAFWLYGGSPVRQPRLLGALAGDVPAIIDQPDTGGHGIGRFRRPRAAPPTRL